MGPGPLLSPELCPSLGPTHPAVGSTGLKEEGTPLCPHMSPVENGPALIKCPGLPLTVKPLTHPCHEFLEVDQRVLVSVQESEHAPRQHGGVRATGPGCQAGKEFLELAGIDAVLLQVGQAGVPMHSRGPAVPPVLTFEVLGLKGAQLGEMVVRTPRLAHVPTFFLHPG